MFKEKLAQKIESKPFSRLISIYVAISLSWTLPAHANIATLILNESGEPVECLLENSDDNGFLVKIENMTPPSCLVIMDTSPIPPGYQFNDTGPTSGEVNYEVVNLANLEAFDSRSGRYYKLIK